ncbi:MAG: type II secretion system F family protein, partial [Campylobacterota bacterium]|nr:type II secretion system F family protein [Campylobacterota bacterium]
MNIIYFLPVIITIIALFAWFMYDRGSIKKQIILLSKLDKLDIIDKQTEIKSGKEEKDTLSFKLIQAGITHKEYNEGRMTFAILGIVLAVALPIFFSFEIGLIGIVLGVICIFFGGQMYLAISKSERVEKIDQDLGVFLDLINVILEAGGGLKNAFFQVSRRANGIIDEELLKEISILEYEMTNYSTKKAYENLKKRVDSEDMGKIVDFLILSEETGLGVKNIFSTQSDEMRQEKFYKIKGKVNTLSMYLMVVIFIFVLPSL